jgi:hypothetical protein
MSGIGTGTPIALVQVGASSPTSGTVAFNPEISDILEDASSMAGAELRTGYDYRMARFALNSLLQQWGNLGVNLWTITSTTLALLPGVATYALPLDIVDIMDAAIRQNPGDPATQSDLAIQRISFPVYSTLPNKLTQGRPVQFLVNRLIAPTVTLWPVPDRDSYSLYYYYMRRVQDAGSPDNTLDMPVRFIPALVAGLAYQIVIRKPGLEQRVPWLKQNADDAYNLAAGEDRERAPTRWVPRNIPL